MTFDETNVKRDQSGKFSEKSGSNPEVSLSSDSPDEERGALAADQNSGVKWNDDGQRSERRTAAVAEAETAEELESRAEGATGAEAERLRDEAAQARERAARAELREKTHVPLKNPFKTGDQLVIPAGTVVYEKDSYGGSQGQMETGRKRNAKAITSFGGYYYHVPHNHTTTSADGERCIILNDLAIAAPYVEWWGRKYVNRVYLTPEFLEANGKAVQYDEEQFDKHAEEIASGGFGVERITKP